LSSTFSHLWIDPWLKPNLPAHSILTFKNATLNEMVVLFIFCLVEKVAAIFFEKVVEHP
jgi:hypothetical protein